MGFHKFVDWVVGQKDFDRELVGQPGLGWDFGPGQPVLGRIMARAGKGIY